VQFGRLTRKALALGLGRGFAVVAQFAINLLLVRWWTPEEFGQFHQVRAVLAVAALLDLGLPVGLLQAASGMEGERRDELFRRGVSLAMVAGFLTGVAFALAGLVVEDAAVAASLPFAGLLIAATIPAAALESVLVVRERHVRASVIGGGAAVAGFIASALVLLWHPTLSAVYACLAAAAIGRLAALFAQSGIAWRTRSIRHLVRLWGGGIWPLVRMSLAVSANRLLGMASAAVDRNVVAALFSAATLGWYVTGAWEVPFMAVFFGAITSAVLPEMSEHWAAGRRRDFLAVWQGAVARAAWIVFPIWLWSWVWAPELLRVLFTAQYEDGLPVFRVYLLMLPLRVAIYSALLVAMNEARLLLWGSVLDFAVNLGVSVALGYTIGPLGPAIATTLGTYLQVVFYLVVLRRRLGISTIGLLPWGDLARAAVASAVAVVPTLIARWWIESDFVRIGLTFALTACVVGVVLFRAFGSVPLKR